MKDFTKLKEYIIQNGDVKTKDALALGYSSYDLKVFLNQSLIERSKHGVYTLSRAKEPGSQVLEDTSTIIATSQDEPTPNNAPTAEQSEILDAKQEPVVEEPTKAVSSSSPSSPSTYQAINRIFNKDYDQALKIYTELSNINPDNEYYDFCISYVQFLKENYNEAYSSLLQCYNKNPEFPLILSAYLALCILKNYVDVPANVLESFKSHIQLEKINYKFINGVLLPIEKGNYPYAEKKLYYFIQGNRKARQFRIGNQYVYAALIDIMQKLGYDIDFHKKTPEQEVVVPEVSSRQILTNTILLNALESHDYATAYRLIEEYEITDAKDLITSLIKKLEQCENKGYQPLNNPTKVVAEEETVTYVITNNDENVSKDIVNPSLQQDSPIVSSSNRASSKPAAPTRKPTAKSDQTTSQVDIQELIAAKHSAYEEYLANCDFASAKKSLIQYDMLLRDNLNYRDLTYLYNRISRYQAEFAADPENFLSQREQYHQALALYSSKEYERVIDLLKTLKPTLDIKLLMVSTYLSLDNLAAAESIISTIEPTCAEPNYYRRMADISYRYGKYQEALNFCFKYNTCKPHRHASIYILMADCYERLRKPGKAIKALRIADAINQENGYNRDLSGRINYFTNQAERNRVKRLIKQNPEANLE